MVKFQLTGDEKSQSLVVLYEDDDPVTVPDTHPNFDKIIDLWRSKEYTEDQVRELVNTMYVVGQQLSKITDRITVAPYGVLFDGDPLRGEIAEVILDFHAEGNASKLGAVANFLEKASTNPSISSIDGLYQWITNGKDLVITPNGNFVAYKGVQVGENGISESITRGEAIVDGVTHTGNIPNPDGAVVEMPRSKVDADGNVHCSTGLHAGTHSYASDFARGRLLLVEINPRDVVSVPNDCNFHKLRVSKYTVLSHIEQRLESRYYAPAEADGDFEDDESLEDEGYEGCEECGYDEYYCDCDDYGYDEDDDEEGCDCDWCEPVEKDEDVGTSSNLTDNPSFEQTDGWNLRPEETVTPPQEPEKTPESDDKPEEASSEGDDHDKPTQGFLGRFFGK